MRCTYQVALYFSLVVTIGLLGYSIGLLNTQFSTRYWPVTTGIMQRVAVSEQSCGRPYSSWWCYRPNVSYTYQVNGTSYSNSQIAYTHDYGDFTSEPTVYSRSHAVIAEQGWTQGGTVTVYYNPDNPSESVLSNTIESSQLLGELWFTISLTGLILIGTMVYVLARWRQKRKNAKIQALYKKIDETFV